MTEIEDRIQQAYVRLERYGAAQTALELEREAAWNEVSMAINAQIDDLITRLNFTAPYGRVMKNMPPDSMVGSWMSHDKVIELLRGSLHRGLQLGFIDNTKDKRKAWVEDGKIHITSIHMPEPYILWIETLVGQPAPGEAVDGKISVARIQMSVDGKTTDFAPCYVATQRQLEDHLDALMSDDTWGDMRPGVAVTITFENMAESEFDALEEWEA
jgi:hypothetical protein